MNIYLSFSISFYILSLTEHISIFFVLVYHYQVLCVPGHIPGDKCEFILFLNFSSFSCRCRRHFVNRNPKLACGFVSRMGFFKFRRQAWHLLSSSTNPVNATGVVQTNTFIKILGLMISYLLFPIFKNVTTLQTKMFSHVNFHSFYKNWFTSTALFCASSHAHKLKINSLPNHTPLISRLCGTTRDCQ